METFFSSIGSDVVDFEPLNVELPNDAYAIEMYIKKKP